jgi:hypothetical protein
MPEITNASLSGTEGAVLDRFRDRHTVAGAKDDRRDALVAADSLLTDQHCFRRVRPEHPDVIRLRERRSTDYSKRIAKPHREDREEGGVAQVVVVPSSECGQILHEAGILIDRLAPDRRR